MSRKGFVYEFGIIWKIVGKMGRKDLFIKIWKFEIIVWLVNLNLWLMFRLRFEERKDGEIYKVER